MLQKPLSPKWYLVLGALSIFLLLVGYTYLSYHQHAINPADTTIPTWRQLKEGMVQMCTPDRQGDTWLLIDSFVTVKRLFLGLFVGIISSLVIGIMMGCFPWVEAFFLPPLLLLAKVPPTAALAVFFVMAGTDTEMYVAMIAFGVLPSLSQTVYLSIKDIQPEFIHKARTLGASQIEIIWNVVFRFIAPKLLDAIRLQIGPAVVYLVAAEMLVADVGFGYRIRLLSRRTQMAVVYPYLIFLALFGFAMDYVLRLLQRVLCPWYSREGGNS